MVKASLTFTDQQWRWLAYATIAVTFCWLSYLSLNTTARIIISQDEVNYIFQARLFASGEMRENIGDLNPYLPNGWSITHEEYRFSKYPPLTSLVLVPGIWLQIPGLVMPLFGMLSLLLVWRIGSSLVSAQFGFISVLLMATSPWFFGYAMSYFSQTLVLAMLLGIAWYLLIKPKRIGIPLVLVFLLGLTRPLDAVAVGITAAIYLWWTKNQRGILPMVIATSLGILALMTYNYMIADRFTLILKTRYGGYYPIIEESSLAGVLSGVKGFVARYLQNLAGPMPFVLDKWMWRFSGYALPLLAILGLFNRSVPSRLRLLGLAVFVMYTLAYGVHPTTGWPMYGARYHYPTLGLMSLAAAAGLILVWSKLPMKNLRFALFALLVCWQIAVSHGRVQEYRIRFATAEAIFDQVVQECRGHDIVFFPREKNRYFGSFVQTVVILRNTWGDGSHPDNVVLGDSPFYIVDKPSAAAAVASQTGGSICNHSTKPAVSYSENKTALDKTLLYSEFVTSYPHKLKRRGH